MTLQEVFLEYHLFDWNDRYDFASIEIGVLPFRSDFRGFIFEDVNLGGLSLDILKRMKPSELDKLMQGKTIAHIGDVVGFMQQLQLVYSDYGSCVPAMEAVEEALTQNFGIQPSRTTVERAKLTVPDSATSEKHLVFRNKLRALLAAKKAMAPTTSAKPADLSTLPQNEQYDDY